MDEKAKKIYLTDATAQAFMNLLGAEPNERLQRGARAFDELAFPGNVAAADTLMGIFGLVRVQPTDAELTDRRCLHIYLQNLEHDLGLPLEQADTVRSLWRRLSGWIPALPVPVMGRREATDFTISWTRSPDFVVIEVDAEGRFCWFHSGRSEWPAYDEDRWYEDIPEDLVTTLKIWGE